MDMLCSLPPEMIREIGAAPIMTALSTLIGIGTALAIYLGL